MMVCRKDDVKRLDTISEVKGFAVTAVAVAGLLAVAGCASAPPTLGGAPDLSVVSSNALPPPGRADFTAPLAPSYLGPSDLLQVTVAGIDWLTDQEIRLDSSGEMSFPLAGPVAAAGLTPRELETLLAQQLVKRGQLVNPQVTVNVKETFSRSVTIEGQVKKAGVYPVSGKITLLQAIALAQSTDEFSSLDDVVVFRTVDNQRYAALYDLKAIRRGVYADPDIYPNDIVMVGDDRGRRLFRDLLAIIPLITTPLVVAIR